MDTELSISDLFAHPDIAGLAEHLGQQNKGLLLPGIAPGIRPEPVPLSFSQERLWFIDKLEGSVQYHIPLVLRLKGHLNIEALENTLRTVTDRHEVLRTVIPDNQGRGCQLIMPPGGWKLSLRDYPGYTGYKAEAGLSAYIAELTGRPFDLSRDYMLRADLIRLDTG